MSIILYLSDGITAMADGQTEAYAAVPGVSGETASPEAFVEPSEGAETSSESKTGPAVEPGQPPESVEKPSGEPGGEPPAEPDGELPESSEEPGGELPEPPAEPGGELPELPAEPGGELPEPSAEPGGELPESPEEPGGELPEPPEEPDRESAAQPVESDGEPTDQPQELEEGTEQPPEPENGPEQLTTLEPDSVSCAEEFQAWMETHRNSGGSMKLTDNITLSGYQVFIPDGPGSPHVFIDTGGYTITIAGEVEFWNDCHLTFQGGTETAVVFRVAEGGMLTLSHISIECASGEASSESGMPYVLWQEEGAALIVADCHIEGEIHFAETPFVLYENTASVIVEKGQQAVFPAEIECDVNFQGQVSYRQSVPVFWDLTGKEQQQTDRVRFQVSGSYPGAASAAPPLCTVIYHDYPLTFTEAMAVKSHRGYIFRCGYAKLEELHPAAIIVEYSFDGENWFLYEEKKCTIYEDFFSVCIVDDQWYTAEYPYLYLRLQCEQEGVRYFSNVLGFAADNLKEAVDQGGTRGGGTSVTNPPKEPELKPGENENPGTAGNNTSSGPETGENAGTAETTGNNISSGPETGENAGTAETTGNNISSGSETGENPGTTGTTENSPASGPKTEETVEATGNIGTTSSSGPGAGENETAGNAEDASPSGPETEETATVETAGTVEAAGTTGNSPSPVTGASAIEAVPGSAFGRTFAIAAGFAGLSAAVGATGFCVHAGLFRRLLQAAGRLFR